MPDDLRIVWPAPFFLATACGPLGLGDLRIAGPFLFLGKQAVDTCELWEAPAVKAWKAD